MMGVQLANVAVARWAPHVSDRAFRVLMRMSLTALDKPSNGQQAAVYFGGVELLVMTLRPGRGGGEESLYRTVRKALNELVKLGAIESMERGRRGHRAVYRLTLDADPKPQLAGLQSPPIRNPESSYGEIGGLQRSETDPLESPLGTIGTTKDDERLDDEVLPFPTEVQTAREDDRSEDDLSDVDEHARFAACPHCNAYLDPDGSCFVCRRRSQMEAS